jgi:hypothetical protein
MEEGTTTEKKIKNLKNSSEKPIVQTDKSLKKKSNKKQTAKKIPQQVTSKKKTRGKVVDEVEDEEEEEYIQPEAADSLETEIEVEEPPKKDIQSSKKRKAAIIDTTAKLFNSAKKNKNENETVELVIPDISTKLTDLSIKNEESIFGQILIQMDILSKSNKVLLESNRAISNKVELLSVKHDSLVEENKNNKNKIHNAIIEGPTSQVTNGSSTLNNILNNNNNNNSSEGLENLMKNFFTTKQEQRDDKANASESNWMKCFVLNHAIATLSKF